MFHHSWPQNQDLWTLYHKVTFDGPNRLIIVNDGELNINIKEDIYSSWKEWTRERDYLKFLSACRSVGGDPTVEGKFLGSTFFTINNWRIQISEGTTFVGNIFSDDFSSPFKAEQGVDLAQAEVSNLIDAIAVNTQDLVDAGIATTEKIDQQTTTLNTTIPTGVVSELNSTTYDGVPYEDIMGILLSMAQGRIVENGTGVFEFYAQDNSTVLYTLTKAGNERNRS